MGIQPTCFRCRQQGMNMCLETAAWAVKARVSFSVLLSSGAWLAFWAFACQQQGISCSLSFMIASAIFLLSLLGQMSLMWPNYVLPKEWSYNLRERNPLQRILVSCLYTWDLLTSQIWFSSFWGGNMMTLRLFQYTVVLSQQQFLSVLFLTAQSPRKWAEHSVSVLASLWQEYWLRLGFQELRNRAQMNWVQKLGT